jgi:type IV pilus assembly protein PilF
MESGGKRITNPQGKAQVFPAHDRPPNPLPQAEEEDAKGFVNATRRDIHHRYRLGLRWIALVVLFTFQASPLLWGCTTQAKMQRMKEATGHYKLGVSYLNDEEFQRAFVEFQKAVEKNPNDRDSHYALGHIYFVQGKYDHALEQFKIVLKINRDDSEGHNYMGKVYEQKGDMDRAIKAYQKALVNPTYLTPDIAHYNLGVVFQNQGKINEAIKEFGQAIVINPDHLLAHYALAQSYADSGNFQGAISSYKDVLRIFPESAEARYQLAWAYLKSGAKSEALSEFGIIIERFPDSGLAQRSRKHLAFMKTKLSKLERGMTGGDVKRALGQPEAVVRRPGPAMGEERWILNDYDLVLFFKKGRYMGYEESPRR